MYEFRSQKDVQRYLESGDVTNCVMIQNKRKMEDLHTARNQSHHVCSFSILVVYLICNMSICLQKI